MTRLRLYCFPYGGAGAAAFRGWSRSLPDWIEVVPVQVPGREARFRDEPCSHVGPLVQDLMTTFNPAGPFALFGHSFGALTAFELARELRRRGREAPEALLVSGLPAPHLPRLRPRISHLPQAELVAALRGQFDLTEELLEHPELLEMALPVLRADFAVVETYVYREEPPFEFPIHVFGGLSDPEASQAELAAWTRHSTRPVPVKMFPGGHFFLNTERERLLEAVTAALREALGSRAPAQRVPSS
jgi:surfactin synthase thioesterase subunit